MQYMYILSLLFGVMVYPHASETHPYPQSNGYLRIEVTACDGWMYGSSANSLQIQLKSQYDTSPFFFVNEDRSLPTNGHTQMYHINSMYHIHSMLLSIVLTMDDSYGYCVKRIAIHSIMHGNSTSDVYHNFEQTHFGMGLILSNLCPYTYISLSRHRALLRCVDDYLELYTQRPRGIYKVYMHTCAHVDSGISAVDMKQNVYSVLMGKRQTNANVYDTTDIEYMDHYAVGELDVDQLGHLIATNILFSHSDPLYLRHVEGRIIGIRLENVDNDHQYSLASLRNKIMIKIDGKSRHLYSISVLNMGKYMVGFLSTADRVHVKASTEIVISGGEVGYYLYLNVYVILDGFNQLYQLPFIIEHDNGMNWFDANQRCMDLHGTHLTSVHSKDENTIISGFIGDAHTAWIGLMDFDINNANCHYHHCDWLWVDRSFMDYTDWDMNSRQSHDGEKDCAFIDGKHGTWSADDCDKRYKFMHFVCGSPHWYPTRKRKLEINVRDRIDEIVVLSIGNDHTEEPLCIDSISVDYATPVDITNHWIGGDSADSALKAVFKAPVCKTEVIEMNVLYETAVSLVVVPARFSTPLFCRNYGRIRSIQCIAGRLQAFGSFAKFRLPNDGIVNEYTSWAHASNVTLTTQQTTSIATTNQLLFDKRYKIHWVTNYPNGSFEINHFVFALKPQNRFYDIYEKVDTEDTEEDAEVFDGQKWEFTPVDVSRCADAATVPPSHLLSFYTYLGGIITTVNVEVDLKLTLCPEFMNQNEKNQDTNVVFMQRVNAQVDVLVATGCQVVWNAPQYIKNTMRCEDEMQLAISEESIYLPRCNSNNSALYDGCQCKVGDKDIRQVCWCVDPNGDKINGKAMYVEDAVTWQETCRIHLNCSNTEVRIPISS